MEVYTVSAGSRDVIPVNDHEHIIEMNETAGTDLSGTHNQEAQEATKDDEEDTPRVRELKGEIECLKFKITGLEGIIAQMNAAFTRLEELINVLAAGTGGADKKQVKSPNEELRNDWGGRAVGAITVAYCFSANPFPDLKH
ncbi:uncharacterized protein MELLADRAFT_106518 [Melampsora larici-populina 98AG31]|uniref:Uncharacterized protein n=1 Tax=Melampsora larici-populina (strain 98AG31 / pathotype 3-4-7) TaxID=747676 RepID=F4RLS0_MELLP|nr:uncharacterized protein MELLADRAFT_106518 [Melampsora larici-populina 98AG31]EGG06704.1 hypothetical protein MELLADRAFT_106518 [Melampsora larici-populina 98AG31]